MSKFKIAFACTPTEDNCIIRREVARPTLDNPKQATPDEIRFNRRRFFGKAFKATAAGVLIPNIVKAATGTAVIVDNTGDKVQSLLNKISVSRPFGAPSGGHFSILRVGVRCSVNGTTLGPTPCFYVGAQSGTTKQPFDATWVNSLIADQLGGTWATTGSGTTLRFRPQSYHATSLVSSTFVDSAAWASLVSISAKTHSGAPCMMMAELIVGSPSWTVKSFSPVTGGTNTAMTRADFLAQLSATTPTWTGYIYNNSPAATFTFSQVAGTIDTACFGWLNTTPLEVTDFAVAYAP